MGGTNVSQTPTSTQVIQPTAGNVGAGGSLVNSSIMPIDLAGGSNNTLSITSLDPGVIAAAAAIANHSLDNSAALDNAATNLAGSIASKANDLAAGSTGSGPYQGLIGSFGKYALGALGIFALGLALFFGLKKKKEKKKDEN